MGLFDKLTGKAKREQERAAEEARLLAEELAVAEELKQRRAAERKAKRDAKKAEEAAKATVNRSAKDIATENGEAWVDIIGVELDPDNIGNGAFELDWNDKFLASLVRAGYQYKPDESEAVIVDRWFQDVCRNVLAENFEQWEANQVSGSRRVETEDLGNGKSSVS